MHFVKTPYKW